MEKYVFLNNKDEFKFKKEDKIKLINKINSFTYPGDYHDIGKNTDIGLYIWDLNDNERENKVLQCIYMTVYINQFSESLSELIHQITLNKTILPNNSIIYEIKIYYSPDFNQSFSFYYLKRNSNSLLTDSTIKNILYEDKLLSYLTNNINGFDSRHQNNGIVLSDNYYMSSFLYIFKILHYSFKPGFGTAEYRLVPSPHLGVLPIYKQFDITLSNFKYGHLYYYNIKNPIKSYLPKLKKIDNIYEFKDVEDLRNDNKKLIHIYDYIYITKPSNIQHYLSYDYFVWSLLNYNLISSNVDILKDLNYTLPNNVDIPTDFSLGFDKKARESCMYFTDGIDINNIKKEFRDNNIGALIDNNDNLYICIYDEFNNTEINKNSSKFNIHDILIDCYKNFSSFTDQLTDTYNNIFIYNFGYYLDSFLTTNTLPLNNSNTYIYSEAYIPVSKDITIPINNYKSVNILQDPIINKKIYKNYQIKNITVEKIINFDKKIDYNINLLHTLYAYDIYVY